MLRERLVQLWAALPAEHKAALKNCLLTLVTNEPERVVRDALARVTGCAATAAGWPSNEQCTDVAAPFSQHNGQVRAGRRRLARTAEHAADARRVARRRTAR